jgi:hypothetical protein
MCGIFLLWYCISVQKISDFEHLRFLISALGMAQPYRKQTNNRKYKNNKTWILGEISG